LKSQYGVVEHVLFQSVLYSPDFSQEGFDSLKLGIVGVVVFRLGLGGL
jgi:hypothetical protein